MKLNPIYLLVIFLIYGCTQASTEPEPETNTPCIQNLKINSVTESFCEKLTSGISSQLATTDTLYVQYDLTRGQSFWSSKNYQAFTLAFANTLPDSNDYESEAKFFEDLLVLMTPESQHKLDIKQNGGFALEVWDKSGQYYSSENGIQTNGAMIEVRNVFMNLTGPIYGNVRSEMKFDIVSTEPIILWNEDKSESIEVEMFYRFLVDFTKFR
jgi:hypothetical protein